MAFPGEDPTGKSALRGELPDSVQFADKVSSVDTFFGLLSGTGWMRNGPVPYFMHNAYANASLCILLSSIHLSRALTSGRPIPSLGMDSHPQSTSQHIITEAPSPRVVVNAVCPGYVNTALWQDSMFWNIVRRLAFKSPAVAAEFIIAVATSSEYENTTGQLLSIIPNIVPSRMAQTEKLEEMVWRESCDLVRNLQQIELGNVSDTTKQ